jgi:hypothetical protein|tara:strand:+ start:263 stop:664 length:402 start_codon:yes stop_codon:yes gene_type:complete
MIIWSETMSYDFNDIMEFRDFISESINRGEYAQEIENFNKGINTISNHKRRWDWVEGGKLYLAKNSTGRLFFIYRHPSEGFEKYLWYYVPHNKNYSTWDTAFPMESWAIEYMLLYSYSFSFMNWINENPFEVK